MNAGELVEITSELLDALAEATDHEPCDTQSCILCDGLVTTDVFSLLHGLERAIGLYMVNPEAHMSEAGQQVHNIMARLQQAPAFRSGPMQLPSAMLAPGLDPRAAHRVYTYLKAVSMDLTLGSGWPRIET